MPAVPSATPQKGAPVREALEVHPASVNAAITWPWRCLRAPPEAERELRLLLLINPVMPSGVLPGQSLRDRNQPEAIEAFRLCRACSQLPDA